MPRKITDKHKQMLISILFHNVDGLNVKRAGALLTTLKKKGYIEDTLIPGEGFQGWKITDQGHIYLSKVRK